MVQKKGAQKGFFYANKNPPALGIAFTKMLAVVTTRESWDVINYIYIYILYIHILYITGCGNRFMTVWQFNGKYIYIYIDYE